MDQITFSTDCVLHNLRSAARQITRRYEELLRPFNLKGGQFSILAALYQKSGLSIGHLSEVLSMDRTTLTRNLRPLIERGLIEREGDDHDARMRRLTLTQSGKALLNSALPAWRKAQEESHRRLSPHHWDELRTTIRRL